MSAEEKLIFRGYKNTVKFDLNSFKCDAEVLMLLGVSITSDVINASLICTATLKPIS